MGREHNEQVMQIIKMRSKPSATTKLTKKNAVRYSYDSDGHRKDKDDSCRPFAGIYLVWLLDGKDTGQVRDAFYSLSSFFPVP
jgi:hypothetical protein